MPKFNVLLLLSLTHVIANRSDSKYLRDAVMAEWLTHLTKDVGNLIQVSPAPQFETFHSWMCVWAFFLPATVKGLRTKE